MHRVKRAIAFAVGVFSTATLVQIVFIIEALRTNYFSGINPLSLTIHIPLLAGVGVASGVLVLWILWLSKFRVITAPSDYYLFGAILGLGGLGNLLGKVSGMALIDVAAIVLAILLSVPMAMDHGEKDEERG